MVQHSFGFELFEQGNEGRRDELSDVSDIAFELAVRAGRLSIHGNGDSIVGVALVAGLIMREN
jgi:hypothetical protein